MPKGEKPTENEHFVPRMYLKCFSEINKSGKALIWQFNLKTMRQTPVQVDVQDICFEKHLYEIKGSNGSFIAQNTIEKTFGKIEANANKVIQSIKAKSEDKNCIYCPHVLSENDKSYLIIFITSLLFRDPITIESGIGYLQKSNPDMDTRAARNFTLLNLLPLGLDPEWDNNTIIRTALGNLTGMAFQIGIADEDVVITSDRPVVIWPPKEGQPYNRPRAVTFPLTSKLLLYLFPDEDVDPIARNCFVTLNKEQINDFYRNSSVSARDWIYSRNPLTEEQIRIISDARRDLNTGKGFGGSIAKRITAGSSWA